MQNNNKIKIVALATTFFIVISFFPFYDFNKKEIVPGNGEFKAYTFADESLVTDSALKKKYSSAKLLSSDKEIKFRYQLRDGAKYIFAGVFFGLKDDGKKLYDISEFNELNIEITVKEGKTFPISILTYEKGITQPNNEMSFRRSTAMIHLEENKKSYSVPLKDFITPDWWYANVGISGKDLPPADYSKVKSFALSNCILQQAGDKNEITIHSVVLSHNNFLLMQLHFLAVIVAIFIWVLVLYVRRKKLKVVAYEKVQYVSEETRKLSDEEKLMQYISVNYSNPDFNLNMVSKAVAIPAYVVSKIIKKKNQMSFKQYLNFIRMEEGKRLLRSSTLSVNEIAYKTGYNNPSHFRRIFKQDFNISPIDYRKSQKN